MKDHKKLSKEFFDMQASIYDEVEEAGGNARSVYPAIIKLMDEHGYDSALDVGCGTGGLIDAVLSEKPGKVLFEIRRVLRKGGMFIMGENYLPDAELKKVNRKLRFSKSGDYRMYSGKELLWMMNGVFSCVHYEPAGKGSCIVWGIR